MIINVPTGQMCIESDAPVTVCVEIERTLYEVMQELGPVLLRAYGLEARGPPLTDLKAA